MDTRNRDFFVVRLETGQQIGVPWSHSQALFCADDLQRHHWRIMTHGTVISWPDIGLNVWVAELHREYGDQPADWYGKIVDERRQKAEAVAAANAAARLARQRRRKNFVLQQVEKGRGSPKVAAAGEADLP